MTNIYQQEPIKSYQFSIEIEVTVVAFDESTMVRARKNKYMTSNMIEWGKSIQSSSREEAADD